MRLAERRKLLFVATLLLALADGTAVLAKQSQAANLSNVRVQVVEAAPSRSVKHRHLQVTFDATFRVHPATDDRFKVKAACAVAGRIVVADSLISEGLDVDPGQTKVGLIGRVFYLEPGLDAEPPASCDITILLGEWGTPRMKPVANLCWDGSKVRSGGCGPSKGKGK